MATTLYLIFLLLAFTNPRCVFSNTEEQLKHLMDIKSALDPEGTYLSSWTVNGDPCGGSFTGIGCNQEGQVANISLQGKGLFGQISPSISNLKNLTGLYLHYNSLHGEIPREIANLTHLTDLYLNVNNLTGRIPHEIGNMSSLKVLQLCYNRLTGNIPTQLSSLKRLNVLALQSNHLSGAIPASLGDLSMLTRLDLSFNHLFGSLPAKLAYLPQLQFLDIQNNTLSGNVPPALKRLNKEFLYSNNSGLCGAEFPSLKSCNDSSGVNLSLPEPYGSTTTDIPETAELPMPCTESHCTNSPKPREVYVVLSTVIVTILLSAAGLAMFITHYRRRKQKLGASFDTSDTRLSTDQPKKVYRKNGCSPLASLEYTNGWDPLAEDGRNLDVFSHEAFQSFMFNLDEVEAATHYFSDANLLGKSNFSATYKGILRDGSVVAIKSISKTSCKSEEAEFLQGLSVLTSLKHDNLVRLRGFCCSSGRGECFLIYEFVSNGSLSQYLDLKEHESRVLEWSTRVSILKGVAKGIAYLHGHKVNRPSLVHQNISAEKVLIDQRYNPLLSDSGLQNLRTNDIVFSTFKMSAAMGYLAPEYVTTGRFTEKSDVYAFGVLVFQILTGKTKVTNLVRLGDAEACKIGDYVDPNLKGRLFEYEAAKLARIAWLCTRESSSERPSVESIVQELANCSSCL